MICLWIDKKKNLTKQKKRGCKSLTKSFYMNKKNKLLTIYQSLKN